MDFWEWLRASHSSHHFQERNVCLLQQRRLHYVLEGEERVMGRVGEQDKDICGGLAFIIKLAVHGVRVGGRFVGVGVECCFHALV